MTTIRGIANNTKQSKAKREYRARNFVILHQIKLLIFINLVDAKKHASTIQEACRKMHTFYSSKSILV